MRAGINSNRAAMQSVCNQLHMLRNTCAIEVNTRNIASALQADQYKRQLDGAVDEAAASVQRIQQLEQELKAARTLSKAQNADALLEIMGQLRTELGGLRQEVQRQREAAAAGCCTIQ